VTDVCLLLDQQDKFVTTEARQGVTFSHDPPKPLGNHEKQSIPAIVTARVVDQLEVVQVHEHESHHPPVPYRSGQCLIKSVVQQSAVR